MSNQIDIEPPTIVTKNAIRIYHRHRRNDEDNRGGVTVAIDVSSPELRLGVAICSINNSYSRKRGIRVATGRMSLIKALPEWLVGSDKLEFKRTLEGLYNDKKYAQIADAVGIRVWKQHAQNQITSLTKYVNAIKDELTDLKLDMSEDNFFKVY